MKKRTKKTLSVSGKVFLRLVLATVLCAIVYLSMMTIGIGMDAFSHVVGYQLYEETEDGEIVCIENHTYKDGEKHLTKAEIEDNQSLTETRDFLPNVKAVFQIVSQIIMLIILAIFPYHIMWEFGNRDDTNVKYHAMFMLASEYIQSGEYEKAQKMLDELPQYDEIDKRQLQIQLYLKKEQYQEVEKILHIQLVKAKKPS